MASQSGPYDAVVIGGGEFRRPNTRVLGVRSDTGHGSAGPGGYVAAIKAAQLGLRVHLPLSRLSISNPLRCFFVGVDGVHREARFSRRHLPERRVHSFESNAEQLAHLPSDETRLEEEGYRGCALI